MSRARAAREALVAALPIMGGYAVLGVPCGILAAKAGIGAAKVLAMSLGLYSGAGQYMVANLWLDGQPAFTIIAAISLINLRQVLYAAALARHGAGLPAGRVLLFAATVTDESFGVNTARFAAPPWTLLQATGVNLFSQATWTLANVVGAVVGAGLDVPTALAAFAMTSIFICLLAVQPFDTAGVSAAVAAAAGVATCKLVGLGQVAVFAGAILGVGVGVLVGSRSTPSASPRSTESASPRSTPSASPHLMRGAAEEDGA